MWSGAGLAAAGTAVLTYSLLHSEDPQLLPCPGGECAGVGRTFSTFGGGESGILIAPLGYSLIGAGAAFSLGTLLYGEEWEMPWIQIAAGVLVGGASYAISAALN